MRAVFPGAGVGAITVWQFQEPSKICRGVVHRNRGIGDERADGNGGVGKRKNEEQGISRMISSERV